jgi:hypothetical protein
MIRGAGYYNGVGASSNAGGCVSMSSIVFPLAVIPWPMKRAMCSEPDFGSRRTLGLLHQNFSKIERAIGWVTRNGE